MATAVVRPKNLRKLAVVFSESVGNDALDTAMYTLAAQSVPSYTPIILSARFMNAYGLAADSAVELVLEDDLSPGVVYDLTIDELVATEEFLTSFTAFSPGWPANRSLNLWDYIPAINKQEDTSEHLQKFIMCIQDQLDTTLSWIDQWTDIIDLDRAPEEWLDHMLRDLGNPFVFEDITELEKRMLLRTLVRIYQLKGTSAGIQAAIRLFMGFESQVHNLRQSGSLLGNSATPIALLGESFVLGAGGPYDFGVVVETTNAFGRALTAAEIVRIRRLIDVVKPAYARLWLPIFVGLDTTERVQISGTEAASTISWRQKATPPAFWRVYYGRNQAGVTPLNSDAYVEVAGTVTTTTIDTPIGTDPAETVYYFTVVPRHGTEQWGFVSGEVRNKFAAPTDVTATPGPRKVTLAWNAVTGATGYRIYRIPSPTASTPIVANNLMFEVLGGATSYEDTALLPGQAFNYSVTALIGDTEGAYSASVTGTPA